MTASHATEPYTHGLMDVGNGHRVYWECHGNPTGRPAVYFHGGPGSGFSRRILHTFDLRTYRVVLFDQRGCGRSRPLANAPAADLRTNTTHHLIADVELLRAHLGIEQWTLLGLSYGIPGVLIHGRFDVSSPLETAWHLSQRWTTSRLQVIRDAGHGGADSMPHSGPRSPKSRPEHPPTKRPWSPLPP